MPARLILLVALLLASLAPLVPAPMTATTAAADAFPGWPATWQGEQLQQLPLSEREAVFGRRFPGRLGRFSTGSRELILRWVTSPTRRLHPARDCLRGAGFAIEPRPAVRDSDGHTWSCCRASRPGLHFEVRERVLSASADQSWPDPSAWYWSAVLGKSRGPWLAVTEVRSLPIDGETSAVPPAGSGPERA